MTQRATLLAIDAGNTRTKWGVFDANGNLQSNGVTLNAELDAVNFPVTNRAIIANVAGEAHAKILTQKLAATEVTFATPAAKACGVLNGYENPSQLGIDRWAALIGAWHFKKNSCVVVNAGTAVTIDALIAKENHAEFVGGMILPGLNLMQKCLHHGTAALPNITENALSTGSIFGKNTRQAIFNGTLAAAIGAINTMHKAIQNMYQQTPQIVLCGGSAVLIQQNFFKDGQPNTDMKSTEIIENLVLDGLVRLSI